MKRTLSFYCLGGIIILTALSCNTQVENTDTVTLQPYFSLEMFIQDEVKKLEAENPSLNKTVKLNDKEETLVLDSIDWEQELTAFARADINKVALLDKYTTDTLRSAEGNEIWQYTAKEKKLKTRKITVQVINGEPQKVEVEIATNNILYSSSQTLVYEVGYGYSITGWQKIKLLAKDDFATQATLVD